VPIALYRYKQEKEMDVLKNVNLLKKKDTGHYVYHNTLNMSLLSIVVNKNRLKLFNIDIRWLINV